MDAFQHEWNKYEREGDKEMVKKSIALVVMVLTLLVTLIGCGTTSQSSSNSTTPAKEKLVVGVTAGPHEQVMKKVKEVAATQGLDIEIKVFNDYVQPNLALSEKALDVNVFQHEPYLDKFKTDRKLDLVSIGKAVTFPMGIYSNKVKSLNDLKEGAVIGLPNDPTNAARAYQLFEQIGLIKLKPGIGLNVKATDILTNPKKLVFKEMDAAFVPRALGDLDAAAINTNFALTSGLKPNKDAIAIEPKDNPWINVIVVRGADKDKPVLKKFVQVYQSPEVKDFINKTFEGAVIAAW